MWHIARRVEELTHEPVNLKQVTIMPTATLGRFAQRCVDEFDPHIVVMHTSGAVVSVESVERRAERFLGGRLLPPVTLLQRASAAILGYRRPAAANPGAGGVLDLYPRAKRLLQRLGLTASFLTVEQATEGYAAAIRVVAAREQCLLLVRGPAATTANLAPGRAARRIRALNEHLRRLCDARRIPFCDHLALRAQLAPHTLPDGTHYDREGSALAGAYEFALLRPLLAG
jgi:hypothetical protein